MKPCGHSWCAPCLSDRLQMAIASEDYYPVQCCPAKPYNLDIESLDDQEHSLQAIAHELTTKMVKYATLSDLRGNTYCCGAFMVQENRAGRTECTGCGHLVCRRCGNEYHGTSVCVSDLIRDKEEDVQAQQKSERLIREKVQRCPGCKQESRKRVIAIT